MIKLIGEFIDDSVFLLAYHFKWSKTEIFNSVYLDEVSFYIENIQREQAQSLYFMAMASANAQTKDPSKMLKRIAPQLQKRGKTDIMDLQPEKVQANLGKLKKLFNKYDAKK